MGSRHLLSSSSSPCLSSLCPSCPFPSSLSSPSSLSFLHHPRASAYTHMRKHMQTHRVPYTQHTCSSHSQPPCPAIQKKLCMLKPPDSAQIQLGCAGDNDCTLQGTLHHTLHVRLTPPSSLCLKMASEPPSSTSGNSGNLPVASL